MLHVFTYSTDAHKASYLFESAAQHGLRIQNLATTSKWNGLQDKLIAMRDKVYSLPESDICCFLDAYDVIINASEDKIIETYRKSGATILFGAEIQLDPPCVPAELYPPSPTRFRFLNSGVYIGTVRAIRTMLEWGNFLDRNDQEYAHFYYIASHETNDLQLDYNCNLVLNMWAVPWNRLSFQRGVIQFMEYSVTPCFIHFNGQSFLDFQRDFYNDGKFFRYKENADDHQTLQQCIDLKRATYNADEPDYLEGLGHTYYRGPS